MSHRFFSQVLFLGALVAAAFFCVSPLVAGGVAEDLRRADGAADLEGDQFPDKVEVEYARGFEVEYFDTYKVVTVPEAWPGATEPFAYLLVQRGAQVPDGYENAMVVEVPVQSIITMSTTYLTHMENLGVLDTLVAHDSYDWLYSPTVRDMAEEQDLPAVGAGSMVNVELVLSLEPEVIMTYGSGSPDFDAHPTLLEAGLPVVMNADFLEPTPLGKAEWVKFIALFYNEEAEANELFSEVEEEYNALAEVAKNADGKPSVLINAPWNGTWVVGSGDSFIARYIADAGGRYIWEDTEGSSSLFLDIETVLDVASDAGYWINPGQWRSLDHALAEDSRFSEFLAFEAAQVFNNDKRRTEAGGSDYYESGAANPHIVLADLVKIFHPELVPDHEFYYYRRLD